MANHVFISYSRKDQDYVHKLEDELRKRGFDSWVDARIGSGERWWRTIVQQIRSCAAFVVVMTPDSEQSDWVEKEVMLALEEGKPVFPLLLRGRRFPILVDRQYVTVSGGRLPPRRFYERLGREARIERAPEEPKPAPPVQRPSHLAEPPIAAPEVARPSIMERTLSPEPEMILIPAGDFLMAVILRRTKMPAVTSSPSTPCTCPTTTWPRRRSRKLSTRPLSSEPTAVSQSTGEEGNHQEANGVTRWSTSPGMMP